MGTGYSRDLHGQQRMPVKEHKNRAGMKGCVPKDPLRPQEYAEAAPEPEELLLYLTALSKTFFLEFTQSVLQSHANFQHPQCPKGGAPQVNYQEEP